MSIPTPKIRRRRVRRPRAARESGDPTSTLQAMLEHVAQGVAMFDEDQRLIVWNKRLREILNVPDAQLSGGRTLEGLVRFMAERGDFGTNAAATEAVICEHVTSLDQPFAAERMLADGRVVEFRRNPLGNGAFVMIYTEVTERRHTEYLLQDNTRELRAMLEKAPVALAVIGQEDRAIKHANARFRKLFGLTDAKSAEQTSLDLYLSAGDQDRILSAPADRRSVDFETEVRRADAGKIWALISSVRFIFEWEPAVLTSFHDISDRRRAETGLQEELDRKRAELAEARFLQLELAPAPFRGCVGNFAISVDVLLE
ncbi:MAG TPA: PAS-domain containing protein, partial [Xanthobacteraceae bacterium]